VEFGLKESWRRTSDRRLRRSTSTDILSVLSTSRGTDHLREYFTSSCYVAIVVCLRLYTQYFCEIMSLAKALQMGRKDAAGKAHSLQ